MRLLKFFLLFFCSLHLASAQDGFNHTIFLNDQPYQILSERFSPPQGFRRVTEDSVSFGAWLRRLPLLPENAPVKDYRNRIIKKAGDSTVAAVVAYDIKGRHLEQCMDILLRLWAEYLSIQGRQKAIQLPMPDGLMLSWTDWSAGKRPDLRGLNFYLQKNAAPDSSFRNFQRYLNTIFEYSGTQTFYHHYARIPAEAMQIGDFIVKKGRDGHAVIILDLVEDAAGNRRALIGQGDTPACQLYVLRYKVDDPWFPVDISESVLPLPIKKKMRWEGLRRLE